MLRHLRAAFVFVILAGAAFSAKAQTVKPIDPYSFFPTASTYWVNERGSAVRFDNQGKGKLAGAYVTAVGCGVGVARPIAGFYSGNSVAFSVDFGATCPSTAAWNGVLLTGSPTRVKTLWYLTSGGFPAWNSTTAGTDLFTQIDATKAPAALRAK